MVFRKSISNRYEKIVIKANKPIYLGLAILSLSKIRMYEYWYDDTKPKYGDNAKLHYMDTDSFIMYIKTVYILMYIKSQQRFMSDEHNVYTEVALSHDDDKRLISYDGITTYPYGISAGILCKQELLSKVSRKC